ncbi:glycosyltransferase family 2 protein [Persicitalea jodogahamensis]|uniref:Glycosyl transferase family A n=1 Tax=Persicitalea jodogahamensis TaxID=402147 RepID=A0A8J3G998_9BACT|nr:glycosyltransferase family 2 protein [Persicitalea jodogahamensis]GHB61460.1 glycosyl transferase family A [Persicitalea jodogahamensis]
MSLFSLPQWVRPHLFEDKQFKDLSVGEISNIQNALQRFNSSDPEVSVVIPVWNEENNIYRTLSSLAASSSKLAVEIIAVNNNSTDDTQKVLDTLGVKSVQQPVQGTPYARQLGLENARGKYHLCADSDTLYPPDWIDLMVKPMQDSEAVTGVYGIYSFLPPKGQSRLGLWLYESIGSLLIRYRRMNKEYLNVYGFNMGLVTETGLRNGGFLVKGNRVYADQVSGSDFVNDSEDGRMAINLMKTGKLSWVTHPKARVFTSSRRLMDDGGLTKAFIRRVKRQFGVVS